MPFSFLHPWFWLGAVAVAAPIWLHLRRKQETNLLRFSALRFLDDQPEPRRRPLQLRDLLLFLLRVLALALLLAGFSWPYLRSLGTVPIRESRVYILDNTLSHQADGGFIRDRNRIVSEITQAGFDLQVAVVELTSTPRVLASFGDGRDLAIQRLQQLQPSFQRGAYLAAFRQANALLANSLGANKRIVFLGDNQANQWTENTSAPAFLRDVTVDLPPFTLPSRPNLSLSEARAQRIFLGDKSLVNFTAKLAHVGEAKTASVSLRANGQVIFNRSVPLDNQPETILLQAQWEADPAIWLRGELAVEGKPDALPGDDHAFFSLQPVVEGRVALLSQSPFLRVALSPEVMRGQWAAQNLDPSRLQAVLDADSDADVLCIDSNYLQSNEARKLLWRYLTNGRGVLLLVNRTTPAISGYLRELGFEVEGTVTTSREAAEKFQFVFSNHPIFHPFLSPDFGNLLDIGVTKYTRLRSNEALPLVFSEKGAPLFLQSFKQPGKLFVAAFGLDREHTSWPLHQTFIPFLDLAFQSARAEDPTPINFEPSEIARLQLPSGSSVKEALLRDGERVLTRVPVDQGKAQLRLPDLPGLYSLTYDDRDQPERIFSVNPPPKESQLAFVDPADTLKTWVAFHTPDLTSPNPASANSTVSVTAVLHQRLWWWMMVSGLLALLLEMLLAEFRQERA